MPSTEEAVKGLIDRSYGTNQIGQSQGSNDNYD